MVESPESNIVIEAQISSIRATIHRRKRWLQFVLELLPWMAMAVLILPVVGLGLIGPALKYLPAVLQVVAIVMALGLYLYLLYTKFIEVAEWCFDLETIVVNSQSVTIERSGFLGLKRRKVFLADDIKGIVGMSSAFARSGWVTRLPFVSASHVGSLMIWRRRALGRIYLFGLDVSRADAQRFLNAVCQRFPAYRYIRGS